MFKEFIKRIPISIGGLTLGIVSLGNLLGDPIAPWLALISASLLVLFLLKLFIFTDLVIVEMKDTIGASVAPTFAMAMVMLAKYAAIYINHSVGFVLYLLGILVHLLLMVYFSKHFRKFINRNEVYASFMIVYGSFGAGSIVAPVFDAYLIGKLVWIVGILTFLPLLYMVVYKDIKTPETEEAKMPLFCIAASNGGLLLTGYFNSFRSFNTGFIIFMIILGQLVYFLALTRLPKYLKLPFYPSFSSFTFPFVINATALKLTASYFENLGYDVGLVGILVTIETIVAVLLLAYVFISYIKYLFEN